MKTGIETETGHSETDETLESKVLNALRKHCMLHSEHITAHVFGRRAYLEGKVPFEKERDMARHCVEAIFGIRSVYNNITFPCRVGRGSHLQIK